MITESNEDINGVKCGKLSTKIRTLVISGGLTYGYAFHGCLRHLEEEGIWNINNIKSIYASSAGSLIAVILALKFNHDIVENYLINRPWHDIIKIDMYSIIEGIGKRGIFSVDIFEIALEPLFAAKDLPMSVTMRELFDITGIDIHILSTVLDGFREIDISYTTHPLWRVVDALYASSSIPLLFSPLIVDNEWYLDGGLTANYPSKAYLAGVWNSNEDEDVLGICLDISCDRISKENTSIFKYILCILTNFIIKLLGDTPKLSQEVHISKHSIIHNDMHGFINSKEIRAEMIHHGTKAAIQFLNIN